MYKPRLTLANERTVVGMQEDCTETRRGECAAERKVYPGANRRVARKRPNLAGDSALKNSSRKFQNMSFRANWICRGARAAVRKPNWLAPSTVELLLCCGPDWDSRKLVWLGKLKNSLRNSRCVRSLIWKVLKIEASHVWKPGPRMELRAALPNEPRGGSVNAQV